MLLLCFPKRGESTSQVIDEKGPQRCLFISASLLTIFSRCPTSIRLTRHLMYDDDEVCAGCGSRGGSNSRSSQLNNKSYREATFFVLETILLSCLSEEAFGVRISSIFWPAPAKVFRSAQDSRLYGWGFSLCDSARLVF